MNKKLRRVLQPRMTAFFVILVLFSALAAVFGQYYLALGEALVTLALFLVCRWTSRQRRLALGEYVRGANEMLHRTHGGEVPFPIALVNLTEDEILWYNRSFRELTGVRDGLNSLRVGDVFPELSLQWLLAGKGEASDFLRFQERRFLVQGSLLGESEGRNGAALGMIYLHDLTELLDTRDEFIRTRPMMCLVLVDNYDELTNNLPDAAISNLNAQINTIINHWADRYGGLLRKLERNRYLLLLESKDLAAMAEDKFSLLESMRAVSNPASIAATVSIGIGKDGAGFRENYDFAALSIEMALSRGGDQAVIKDRYDFSFFGGRFKTTERRTKVKSRVMAASLSELIAQSGRVFIMGHKMADLDALGAAAGLCCLCRKKGKKAYIVLDREKNAAASLLSLLETMPEYEGSFLGGQDALLMADAKSLLIVVDTNRPDQVECKPLLESLRRVVVIDHHRRAADYIEQPVLNLHEPYASSASELVSELLEYSVEPGDIPAAEAAALLAGIALDTKNFSIRTSSRTFEAAAFLRRIGADTVLVKKLFQNDLPTTVARYKIIQNARLYRGTIAIAALDYTATRTIAAQAADELLNISGIETSFVLYPQEEQTIISARSIGEANVQAILEPLGGGGNAATAGAQVKGKNVPTTLEELLRCIDNFFAQLDVTTQTQIKEEPK